MELYDTIRKYEDTAQKELQEYERFMAIDEIAEALVHWDRFAKNDQLAKWLQQLYDIQEIAEHYKNVNPEAFLKICEVMNKQED